MRCENRSERKKNKKLELSVLGDGRILQQLRVHLGAITTYVIRTCIYRFAFFFSMHKCAWLVYCPESSVLAYPETRTYCRIFRVQCALPLPKHARSSCIHRWTLGVIQIWILLYSRSKLVVLFFSARNLVGMRYDGVHSRLAASS